MPVHTGGVQMPGIRSDTLGPYAFTGAPVNGTTLAGIAGPGALAVQTDGAPPRLFINVNSRASPTWVVVGTQA
jgi:hypothetical protein